MKVMWPLAIEPQNDDRLITALLLIEQYGPFSHQELLRRAQNAELLPTDLVWKAGFADWMPASSIPGLLKRSAPEGPKPTALDPDTFDKGEKINRCADELRRLAMSQTATESDAIVALETALGMPPPS